MKPKEKKDLLYQVAKIIAESDSIGEGYSYCENYTREQFEEENQYTPNYVSYVSVAQEIIDLVKEPDESKFN